MHIINMIAADPNVSPQLASALTASQISAAIAKMPVTIDNLKMLIVAAEELADELLDEHDLAGAFKVAELLTEAELACDAIQIVEKS